MISVTGLHAQRVEPPGAPVIGKETGKTGETYLRSTPFTRKVEIQWKEIEGATRYIVELYGSRDNLMLRQRVPENKVNVNLKPGDYTIRVAALNKLGARGIWSDRAPVKVYPKNGLAPEKVQERIEILTEIKENIVEDAGPGGSEALGIGASEIFGIGMEYGFPAIDFAVFNDFYGGTIFFRYHRLFLDNLKPELRLSFLYGETSDPAIEALTVMRLLFHVNYSLPLFNHTFFIVPDIGAGASFVSLSSPYIGANYFPLVLSTGLELSYEPMQTLRIFLSYDFVYFFLAEKMQFHLLSAGVIIKF